MTTFGGRKACALYVKKHLDEAKARHGCFNYRVWEEDHTHSVFITCDLLYDEKCRFDDEWKMYSHGLTIECDEKRWKWTASRSCKSAQEARSAVIWMRQIIRS